MPDAPGRLWMQADSEHPDDADARRTRYRELRPGWCVVTTPPYRVVDHAARPGPMYWDFRCLTCGDTVSAHAPWWFRAWRRLRHKAPAGEPS
jgi:hypothetical protein